MKKLNVLKSNPEWVEEVIDFQKNGFVTPARVLSAYQESSTSGNVWELLPQCQGDDTFIAYSHLKKGFTLFSNSLYPLRSTLNSEYYFCKCPREIVLSDFEFDSVDKGEREISNLLSQKLLDFALAQLPGIILEYSAIQEEKKVEFERYITRPDKGDFSDEPSLLFHHDLWEVYPREVIIAESIRSKIYFSQSISNKRLRGIFAPHLQKVKGGGVLKTVIENFEIGMTVLTFDRLIQIVAGTWWTIGILGLSKFQKILCYPITLGLILKKQNFSRRRNKKEK